MPEPKIPRAGMLAVACFQNFACGGLLFGWAAISSSLLIASVQDGGAALSRGFVHQLFVIGSSINFTAPLLLGAVLDSYGPRVCSALSISFVASGMILFSVSSPSFHTALPAIMLISFGGPGVQSSIIHLSNLYPASKATVTSIITGSFNLSFIIFFLFDRLWFELELSYQHIFAGYSLICIIALVLSVAFWPDQPFDYQKQMLEEPQAEQPTSDQRRMSKIRAPSVFKKTTLGRLPGEVSGARPAGGSRPESKAKQTRPSSASTKREKEDIKEASFWDQLRSSAFIRVTTFIVVGSFWANFFIGTIDIQLGDENFLPRREQNFMVRLFTAITTMGVLGIPIVGTLMDNCGFVITATVTITMAVIYSFGISLAHGPLQLIFAFIAYAFFRTFLFTYFFAFLADSLGFRYFGILAGMSFLIAGLASLLQAPLLGYAKGTCHLLPDPRPDCFEGRWSFIHFTQLGCLFCLYIIPALDYMTARHQRSKAEGKGEEGALIARSEAQRGSSSSGPSRKYYTTSDVLEDESGGQTQPV